MKNKGILIFACKRAGKSPAAAKRKKTLSKVIILCKKCRPKGGEIFGDDFFYDPENEKNYTD